MIEDTQQKIICFFSSLTVFVLFVATFSLYFYSKQPHSFLILLFESKLFHLPLILYFLSMSIVAGGIIYLLLFFFQRNEKRKLNEKLHLLASGVYQHESFNETRSYQQDLLKIAQNVQRLAQELAKVNSKPEVVAGQTKEDILKEERHRLARELHDSVSQQLFAAMMMLSALSQIAEKKDLPESVQKQLTLVNQIVNTAQGEMRALLLHLRPLNLEGKTLQTGIKQLLNELQTKVQLDITWQIDAVSLNRDVEDHLFRIVQELISNTLRHAKANHLEVYLTEIKDRITLRFVDDGVGFDVKDKKTGSYGLSNMKERVEALGGYFHVISLKGQGTSVEIKIPFTTEK